MNHKYDLSVFEKAAADIDAGAEFCCNRINDHAAVHNGPELELFKEVFEVTSVQEDYKNATFDSKWSMLTGKLPSTEELQETRVLSLCLAHEIARLKNNRKDSGF